MKILLDAGHYGKYNQSPANKSYWESEQMWKLHKFLGAALQAYSIEVGYTRTDQSKDISPSTRGAMAKGYDLLLSLHSNAVSNAVNENVDYPVTFVSLDGKGNNLGQKLVDIIHKTMGTNQAGHIATKVASDGDGDYYGVIRGARSVGSIGMIMEHSFHTNTKSTNWLLSDENLKKLAEAEAATIAEYYGVAKPTATSPKLGIDTDEAIDNLNKAGVITSPSYWKKVALETPNAIVRGDYVAGLIRNFAHVLSGK